MQIHSTLASSHSMADIRIIFITVKTIQRCAETDFFLIFLQALTHQAKKKYKHV